MKTWLKGGLWGLIIIAIFWIGYSLWFILKYKGNCPFWDSPDSLSACFILPTTYSLFAVLPIIIVGAIIGLIIEKSKSKK